MGECTGRVFVTGDIHGSIDIRKLGRRRWPEGATLTRDDYLVICGDFGLVWSDPPSASDEWWLGWLEDRPWTTLFVDGNHENHDLLDAMSVTEWHGGKVHVLPGHPHVIHLMRGQVYDMGPHGRWFTFGGAASHDRAWRTPYVSWWPREFPSAGEMEEGLDNLEAVGNEVDYVFTHDCPARHKGAAMIGIANDPERVKPDGLNRYLDVIDDLVSNGRLRRWYCGHYHADRALRDERHVLLYDRVVELGESVPARTTG